MSLKINLQPKLLRNFIILSAIFFPIWTVWHEFGHFLSAKILGWDAHLEFAGTLVFPKDNIWALLDPEIACSSTHLIITATGPIFTWLIIIIAFFLFLKTRKEYFLIGLQFAGIHLFNFVFVIFSFLEPIFNQILFTLPKGKSDYTKITTCLNLPRYLLHLLTFIMATIILILAVRIIPKERRITIMIAAVIGSAIGAVLWVFILGPNILPGPDIDQFIQ